VKRRRSSVLGIAITAVYCLASFSSALPATAAETQQKVVAQGGGLGAGWVSFMIGSDGKENVTMALKAHNIQTPNAFQIYMYDDEDKFLGGFGRLWTRAELGVYVDAHAPGVPDITYEREVGASGTDLWEWTAEITPRNGVTKLLVWSGGPQAGWSWTLRGGDAVRLLGIESGPGAHVIQSNDMSGLADARVHPVEWPACPYVCMNGPPGARASLDRSKTVMFENSAIGFYLDMANDPPVTNNVLNVDTPLGEKLCFPGCSFPHYKTFRADRPAWPMGSYRFRVDAGQGAGTDRMDEILAVLVDAQLPALPSPELVFNGESALSGAPGERVPVAVTLTDGTGSPVPGAVVTFQLHDGNTVIASTAGTGPDGVARVSIDLPTRAGLWLLTASADAAGLAVAPASTSIQTVEGPTPVVPEVSWAPLIPLAGVAVLGIWPLVRHRRRSHLLSDFMADDVQVV